MTNEELAQKVAVCLIFEGFGADVHECHGGLVRVDCRYYRKIDTRPTYLGYVRIDEWCRIDGSTLVPGWEERIMQILRHLDQFEIRG